jgi:hypothetical protein
MVLTGRSDRKVRVLSGSVLGKTLASLASGLA